MSISKIAHITAIDQSLRYLLLNQLLSIQQAGYTVVGISSPGPGVPFIEATGIRHIPVPMTRNVTPFQDLLTLWKLYRLIRRERFTIINTHTPKPGLLGQLAACMAGVPIVVNTLHGFYFRKGMNKKLRSFYVGLEKIAARCSDIILSQNYEDIETAIREGVCKAEKIKYLGNGIDVGRFNPANLSLEEINHKKLEVGLPENAKIVGFVGRLVREKGLVGVFIATSIM